MSLRVLCAALRMVNHLQPGFSSPVAGSMIAGRLLSRGIDLEPVRYGPVIESQWLF